MVADICPPCMHIETVAMPTWLATEMLSYLKSATAPILTALAAAMQSSQVMTHPDSIHMSRPKPPFIQLAPDLIKA